MWPITRKLLGVFPILAGLWCLCYPAPGVWQVKLQDLGRQYQERMGDLRRGEEIAAKEGRKPILSSREAAKGLDEFVNRKAGRRRKKVEGEAWKVLFKQVEDVGSRQGGSSKFLYLPANIQPLASWVDDEYPNFMLDLPGKYPVFLWAGLYSTHSAMYDDDIPWRLTHPYSGLSPWLIGAGAFFYILLPWHRRRDNEASYKRSRSVIGPDITGLLLTGFFMVLPLFIITQITKHPHPLSLVRGENVVGFICWFIAAMGASSFVISAWYEGLRFVINSQGITKVNLWGVRFYSFEQMIEAKPLVWTPPGWFKKISWLMIFVNWRMAGPVMLGAHSQNQGIALPCRDGRNLNIWADKLVGMDKIHEALRGTGINIPEQETKGSEK